MDKRETDMMFKNTGDDRETPQDCYEMLNDRFGFNLDPCATDANHKCEKYFTEAINGLEQDWQGRTVFVNPPYSQNKAWLKKCYEESRKDDTIVVVLIPSRTDTRYWHDYVMKANILWFVKGRLKFGTETNTAPFPSAVAVFSGATAYSFGPEVATLERP